MNISLILQTLR